MERARGEACRDVTTEDEFVKRMFMAMLSTETNTFSPIPTGLNVWRDMLKIPLGRADTSSLWPFVEQPLEDRAAGKRRKRIGQL